MYRVYSKRGYMLGEWPKHMGSVASLAFNNWPSAHALFLDDSLIDKKET